MVTQVRASPPLRYDHGEKGPTYSREGIPAYWIVNLVDWRIETYSDPGPTGYRQRRDYAVGESVPLTLDGREVALIPLEDLLP
jgi:Uma2 family endonuclease